MGAAIYAASLLLPAVGPFRPEFSDTVYSGSDAFLVGWKALCTWEPRDPDWWLLSSAWLSNPVLWASMLMAACGQWRAAMIAAACSLALGLLLLPRYYAVLAGQPGYWAWLVSILVTLTGNIAVLALQRSRAETIQPVSV
jgi:hypothetical protein